MVVDARVYNRLVARAPIAVRCINSIALPIINVPFTAYTAAVAIHDDVVIFDYVTCASSCQVVSGVIVRMNPVTGQVVAVCAVEADTPLV